MLYNYVSSEQVSCFTYFFNIKRNMRFNKLTAVDMILSHFSYKHLFTYSIRNIVITRRQFSQGTEESGVCKLHARWTTQYCIAISVTSLFYTHYVYPIMRDELKLSYQCKTQTTWTDVKGKYFFVCVIHHLLDSFIIRSYCVSCHRL
jgi:hypothetical protein